MVPVAEINPPVSKLPPVTLPVALARPLVSTLPAVTLPGISEIELKLKLLPEILPPVEILPATDKLVKVPTVVIAVCDP